MKEQQIIKRNRMFVDSKLTHPLPAEIPIKTSEHNEQKKISNDGVSNEMQTPDDTVCLTVSNPCYFLLCC